jgi:tetratricopeptide (TPR) repeat protein
MIMKRIFLVLVIFIAVQAGSVYPAGLAEEGVTKDLAIDFAGVLEKTVVAGDQQKLGAMLDVDALVKKTTAGVDASPTVKAGFGFGMKTAFQKGGIMQQVAAVVRAGGGYKLLRIREQGSRPLFRLLLPNGSVNYHELFLVKNAKGVAVIEDIFVFASGETISQTMRRTYIELAVRQDADFRARLEGKDSDFVKHLRTKSAIIGAIKAKQNKRAMTLYNSLPEKQQKDKLMMLLRVKATQGMSEEEYAAAMEAYRKQFPKDPSIDVLSIDAFFMKKKYAEARRAIDRVNKNLGGDPYLDVLRSQTYIAAGETTAARKCLDRAIKSEPDLIQAYWAKMDLSMKEKKYGETVELIKVIEKRFDRKPADLARIPEYAEFVKSPEYAQWMKERESQK